MIKPKRCIYLRTELSDGRLANDIIMHNIIIPMSNVMMRYWYIFR